MGGVPKQSTRKFLSDSAEVTEEEPEITEENFAQYNALLWPLKEVESALILKFCRSNSKIDIFVKTQPQLNLT